MHSSLRPSRRLSLLALAGTLAFLACLLALNFLELRSEPAHMSQFVHTRYGALFVAGAYAFLLAVVSAVLCLRRTLGPGRSAQAGVALLLLSVPFGFLVATFPEATGGHADAAGAVHTYSVPPLFLFVTAAMLVLVPGLRAHPRLRPLAAFSLVLGILAALAMTAYQFSELWFAPAVGPAQRVMVGAVLAWFLGVAVSLRRWPAEVGLDPAAPAAAPVAPAAEPVEPAEPKDG